MEILIKEIDHFIECCKVTNRTKYIYIRELQDFTRYLHHKTNTPIEELHLQKIYSIRDKSNTLKIDLPINAEIIDQYLYSIVEKGYYKLTCARNALGSFFKYLYKNYDITNIMELTDFKLKEYAPQTKPVNILRRLDILKFWHSVVTYSQNVRRDILLFVILLSTGCRISEILNLKVKDLDLENEMFSLSKTKSKKTPTIVMRYGFGTVLAHYCFDQNLKSDDFVFLTSDRTQMTRNLVENLLHFYLDKVNLERVRIHSLRHSFATLLYEVGMNPISIMQLLTHSNIQTTKGYIDPHYVRNQNLSVNENKEFYKKMRL